MIKFILKTLSIKYIIILYAYKMETWRYGLLFSLLFIIVVVPAIIGMYWLLYIYPYDKKNNKNEGTNEDINVGEGTNEELHWTDNPLHITDTSV